MALHTAGRLGAHSPSSASLPAVAALGKKGLKGNRVSDVAVTYKLMKLDRSRAAARVFDSLDKAILPAPITAVGGFEVADIGCRHTQ